MKNGLVSFWTRKKISFSKRKKKNKISFMLLVIAEILNFPVFL